MKYKIKGDPSECSHEQIVETSYRAGDTFTDQLREKFPAMSDWPVVVALDPHAGFDFVVVISNDTKVPAIPVEKDPESVSETVNEPTSAIRPGNSARSR